MENVLVCVLSYHCPGYLQSLNSDGSMPIFLVHIVSERSVYLGFVGHQKPLDAVIIAFILFTVLITRAMV